MIIVQHVKTGLYVSHSLNANRRDSILQAINGNSRGINIHADVLEMLIEKAFKAENVFNDFKHLDGKIYHESIRDYLVYLQGLIDNLPGTVTNADLRMAMVALDGTKFDTLRARLEYDLNYCLAKADASQDGLMPKEYAAQFEIDEVAGKPAKILEFNITRHIAHSNAIVQAPKYSRGTAFWYLMQRVDNDTYGSNLHVLQYDGTEPTGEWMDLKDTYHGSAFFLKTVNGVDHIFVGINRTTNGSPTTAEITWASKTTKGWGDSSVKAVGHQDCREPYVVVDETRNLAVIRYVGYHNNDEIQVWKYDDWYNDSGSMLYHFNINGAEFYPCQGFDANAGKFYWHSGTDANSNERVSVFDYAGKLLISRDLTGYNLIGSDTAQGKAEPEGLCLVTDDGGNPMVAFGHACGPQYGRRYILHAFNFEAWLSEFTKIGGQASHVAKHAPVNLTSLSSLGPGYWYLTAAQMRAAVDKPQDYIVYKDLFSYTKTWIYAVLIKVIKMPNGYMTQHITQLRPDHKRKAWNRLQYQNKWPDPAVMGSIGHGWVPDDGQVLLWKGSIKAKGDKATFFNHATHYSALKIGWRNLSASSQTVNYSYFEVTKKSNGNMAMSTVPIHDLNLPNTLGTQGNNFLWAFETNLHIISTGADVVSDLRVSMAPDWHAAIPNTTAARIEITEIWGLLNGVR